MAGIGSFRGQSVAFVGHQKGRDLKERTYRNFGMPRPEGYRKAMRVFELAGRLGFPVVTLIDTPGAYPGVGAEQRGQSGAIARSQLMLMSLPVPVVACVIGEGSSGGALAIGVADRVLMQQHSIYTVISPEGCAAILWKESGEANGRPLRCAPPPTPAWSWRWSMRSCPSRQAGHRDHGKAAELLGDAIAAEMDFLGALPAAERRHLRRQKFHRMGAFAE